MMFQVILRLTCGVPTVSTSCCGWLLWLVAEEKSNYGPIASQQIGNRSKPMTSLKSLGSNMGVCMIKIYIQQKILQLWFITLLLG